MPTIKITVAAKIATNTTPGVVIVCGNSDYTVSFAFDSEWAAQTKRTARFVYCKDGQTLYQEAEFTGNTVAVPVLSGIDYVLVGVYAGNLITTTPAKVLCDRSILCGDQKKQAVEVSEEEMASYAEAAAASAQAAAKSAEAAAASAQAAAESAEAVNSAKGMEILAEQDVAFSPFGNMYMTEDITPSNQVFAGDYYTVYWNGSAHTCKCIYGTETGGTTIQDPIIGNLTFLDSTVPDTKEPFLIIITDAIVIFTNEPGESQRIGIYTVEQTPPGQIKAEAADEGKFLRVVNGKAVWVALTDVSQEGV